jgi:1,4-alpha-glucan branching enzyme
MSTVALSTHWAAIFEGDARFALERVLPAYIERRAWYRTPESRVERACLAGVHRIPGIGDARIVFVELTLENGSRDVYVQLLAFVAGEDALRVRERHPDATILAIEVTGDNGETTPGFVVDGLTAEATLVEFVEAIARGAASEENSGLTLRFHAVRTALDPPIEDAARSGARFPGEPTGREPHPFSSRTSTVRDSTIAVDDRWVAKLIHKIEPDESPELEMTRFLGAAGYRHIPALSGWIELRGKIGGVAVAPAVAVLSRYVPNRGDGLAHLSAELDQWLDEIVPLGELAPPKLPPNDVLTRALFPLADDIVLAVGDYVRSAALLGMRVGEMHKLLSRTHIDTFAPEPLDAALREKIAAGVRRRIEAAEGLLATRRDRLSESARTLSEFVAGKHASIDRRLLNVTRAPEGGVRIRIHGDLHLAQVLFTGTDFIIVDFQGDPAEPMTERKAKRSPFVDVAGMLRSFHHAAVGRLRARPEQQQRNLSPWVSLWHKAVAASFLGGWLRAVAESSVLPSAPAVTRALLDLFLLERCAHEIEHAIRHRPDWVDVPLEGIRDLLETERKPGQMRTSMRFTPFVASADVLRVEPSPLDANSPAVRAFTDGTATDAHRFLGFHLRSDGLAEVAVWAPTASQVSVVGDFNDRLPEAGLLAPVGDTGLFAGLVRGARSGHRYHFRIVGMDSAQPKDKADPFAHARDPGPAGASVVASYDHSWSDEAWMAARRERASRDEPISIYAVDLESWEPSCRTYRQIAKPLAELALGMGFTHVELMPLLEYPLDGSLQAPSAFFAPASRYGSVTDLMFLVDTLHQAGLGVIVSWPVGSFARDQNGLASFDGGPTFESDDPVRAIHPASGAGMFDVGRPQVRSFLLSSACFWIEHCHADGLRVDGLAGVLYRDYGRTPGMWSPNAEGGRESLEGVAFVRQLTTTLKIRHPDVHLIADGSSAWRGVTSDPTTGGLGFDLAWDTRMSDDMQFYLALDPNERAAQRELLTYRSVNAAKEAFILALEIANDRLDSSAKVRLLHAMAWAQPGKKLVFHELEAPSDGLRRMLSDLNRLYRATSALGAGDRSFAGFEWTSGSSFVRRGPSGEDLVVAVFNFTSEPREYRVAVPLGGRYREIFNSDAASYGGAGHPTAGGVEAQPSGEKGSEHAIVVRVSPLAAILLARE